MPLRGSPSETDRCHLWPCSSRRDKSTAVTVTDNHKPKGLTQHVFVAYHPPEAGNPKWVLQANTGLSAGPVPFGGSGEPPCPGLVHHPEAACFPRPTASASPSSPRLAPSRLSFTPPFLLPTDKDPVTTWGPPRQASIASTFQDLSSLLQSPSCPVR